MALTLQQKRDYLSLTTLAVLLVAGAVAFKFDSDALRTTNIINCVFIAGMSMLVVFDYSRRLLRGQDDLLVRHVLTLALGVTFVCVALAEYMRRRYGQSPSPVLYLAYVGLFLIDYGLVAAVRRNVRRNKRDENMRQRILTEEQGEHTEAQRVHTEEQVEMDKTQVGLLDRQDNITAERLRDKHNKENP
jgi:hypothetical protein